MVCWIRDSTFDDGIESAKEKESFFTLHYNIYSDVGEETYVLPWAPRKLYPDLGAETYDICIFLRSVWVLLMNIDRYDPVFECYGVRNPNLGSSGLKPIESFELKADMSTVEKLWAAVSLKRWLTARARTYFKIYFEINHISRNKIRRSFQRKFLKYYT